MRPAYRFATAHTEAAAYSQTPDKHGAVVEIVQRILVGKYWLIVRSTYGCGAAVIPVVTASPTHLTRTAPYQREAIRRKGLRSTITEFLCPRWRKDRAVLAVCLFTRCDSACTLSTDRCISSAAI